MEVVSNKKSQSLRTIPPNSVKVGAYLFPTQYNTKQPQQYRAGSPYQQIVQPQSNRVRKPHTTRFTGSNRRNPNLNQRLTAGNNNNKKKSSDYKLVCFVTSWSFYRKDDGHFVPERIDNKLCSHIIYSYASLDPDSLTTISFDPWGDISNQLYQRAVSHANGIPILLGLGGWTDSHGDKYTKLVSSPQNRAKFITDTITFLNTHGFSGLHIGEF